jgi:putative ABC transport system permease protein
VLVSFGSWRNPDSAELSGRPQTIMLIGFRPEDGVFRPDSPKGVQQVVDRYRGDLQLPGRALVDSRSHREFWPIDPPRAVEVGKQRVEIVGQFTLGTGFGANGLILVSDTTFGRIARIARTGQVSLGLVRLAPGSSGGDAREVARRLQAVLPEDVQVMTRTEVCDHERDHWLNRTSIGLIFFFGVVVALIVGVVFVYQVIASDVGNRLHEYATLKAMGYGGLYLALIVVQQAVLVGGLGYLPGVAVAWLLYVVAHSYTGIPIGMEAGRAVWVLLLTVGMCALSGVLASWKVQAADPADLF